MIDHVDVFVMAPGDKKKPLIRELEAIVQTIKF
jgi:ribosomal protein S11